MSADHDAIVITAAARTPVGSFNGALASVPAHDLGRDVIREVVRRAGIEASDVNEVILGQILTAGHGQNPARQASVNAGLPVETPAWGINQLCGSGLRAVALGYQQILEGSADIVIAGGQGIDEPGQPLRPSAQWRPRWATSPSSTPCCAMGLMDAFNDYHMGTTAENVARQWQITRETQGRLRRREPEQGRGRPEGRPLRRRDHPRHRARPQGRHGRREGRVYPS